MVNHTHVQTQFRFLNIHKLVGAGIQIRSLATISRDHNSVWIIEFAVTEIVTRNERTSHRDSFHNGYIKPKDALDEIYSPNVGH